jgi:heme exporter protein CcmD
MMHFLAMGKYAAYVWPSYGVSFVGLAAAIILTWRGYAHAKRTLADAEKSERP